MSRGRVYATLEELEEGEVREEEQPLRAPFALPLYPALVLESDDGRGATVAAALAPIDLIQDAPERRFVIDRCARHATALAFPYLHSAEVMQPPDHLAHVYHELVAMGVLLHTDRVAWVARAHPHARQVYAPLVLQFHSSDSRITERKTLLASHGYSLRTWMAHSLLDLRFYLPPALQTRSLHFPCMQHWDSPISKCAGAVNGRCQFSHSATEYAELASARETAVRERRGIYAVAEVAPFSSSSIVLTRPQPVLTAFDLPLLHVLHIRAADPTTQVRFVLSWPTSHSQVDQEWLTHVPTEGADDTSWTTHLQEVHMRLQSIGLLCPDDRLAWMARARTHLPQQFSPIVLSFECVIDGYLARCKQMTRLGLDFLPWEAYSIADLSFYVPTPRRSADVPCRGMHQGGTMIFACRKGNHCPFSHSRELLSRLMRMRERDRHLQRGIYALAVRASVARTDAAAVAPDSSSSATVRHQRRCSRSRSRSRSRDRTRSRSPRRKKASQSDMECQRQAWQQMLLDERKRAEETRVQLAAAEAEVERLGGRVIQVKHELLETASRSAQQLDDQAARASQELRELQQDMRTCIICQDQARSVLLLTCGHWQLCGACYDTLPQRRCPSCDTPFHAKRVKRDFTLFA